MKNISKSRLIGIVILSLLVLGLSCANTATQDLREQFVDGFIETHNSMAEAEVALSSAMSLAEGGAYTSAVSKISEAELDSQHALLSLPWGVVSDMQKQNTGVSENEVLTLLATRVSKFRDGIDHFLEAMRYIQQSDISGHNQEIAQANSNFSASWDAEYSLQDKVKTDANLNYLRQALGW